jgi:hypothetical protein
LDEINKRYLKAEALIASGQALKAIRLLEDIDSFPDVDKDRSCVLKAVAYLKINRIDDAAEIACRISRNSIYAELARSIQAFALMLNGEMDKARDLMAAEKPVEYLRVAQFFLEQGGRVAQEGRMKFPGHKVFEVFLESFKM